MNASRMCLAAYAVVLLVAIGRTARGEERPDAAAAAAELERRAAARNAEVRLAAFMTARAHFNAIHAMSTEDGGDRVIEIVKARWVPVLLTGCDDGDGRVRAEAAGALRLYARWGADAIAPRLVALVDRSEDPVVRAAAADVLGAAGPLDEAAHRILLRRLREPVAERRDRRQFAVALGVSGGRAFLIQTLRAAIERRDAAEADACLDGLTPGRRRLAAADVVEVSDLLPAATGETRHDLVVVVARAELPASSEDRTHVAGRLGASLGVADPVAQYETAVALVRLGPDARGQAAALERALREPSEERTRAALASAIVGVATADGAAATLIPFLDDPSSKVRSVVAWTLGEVTKDRAAARAQLERRLPCETDAEVLADLRAALARLATPPK